MKAILLRSLHADMVMGIGSDFGVSNLLALLCAKPGGLSGSSTIVGDSYNIETKFTYIKRLKTNK